MKRSIWNLLPVLLCLAALLCLWDNRLDKSSRPALWALAGLFALAVTLGSRLTGESFDVQFEKASADAEGAYTMINCEFAKFIREKYPDIRYLDREEDMGIDGLRRAKQSYHPHHMIEKFSAVIAEG